METRKMYIPATVRGTDFDPDQREFDFMITTDRKDSYGTIFKTDGWDFTRYLENPVVFYNHRSGGDDPDDLIGITVKGPTREKLADGSTGYVATVRFESADINPKAEKIRKKIIAGTIRMASIGAMVKELEWDEDEDGNEVLIFTSQELFEWSVVNIGANPGAILKSNEETLAQIRSEKNGGIPKKPERKTGEDNGLNDVQVARLEIAKRKSKFK